MKKILQTLLLSILITNCAKKNIQIFETNTINAHVENDCFIYETDTVKITYSFWTSKGVMSFAIFNKSEKPIYIDWKNSSFIYNDNKLNYWIEETQTNAVAYYGGYFYNGPLLKAGYTYTEGFQNSISITVKPERETFIPPHSNYYRSQFYLLPIQYFQLKLDCQKEIVTDNNYSGGKTTIYKEEYSLNNSPLRFRNYLAFSFSDNSQQFFFVDNEFYLSSVKEMNYRHYLGDVVGDNKGKPIYNEGTKNEFEKGTSFYIVMPLRYGVDYSLRFLKMKR